MKRVHLVLSPMLLAVATALPLQAGAAAPSARPVFTPPVYVMGIPAPVYVYCTAVNVTDEALTVQTDMVTNEGVAVLSHPVPIGPGMTDGVGRTVTPDFFLRAVYCRFRVLDGANTGIRAMIQVGEPVNLAFPAQ